MNIKWTSHLESGTAEKEEFKQLVLAAKPVLNRLIQIMEKDCKAKDVEQLDFAAYDSVNWPLKQADLIASKRLYKKLIEFCTV